MISTARMAAAAAALTVALAAAPAWAAGPSKAVFAACDGYGGPSKSGDGMTEPAYTLGIFRPELGGGGTTAKGSVPMGAQGVSACDAALAHPDLLPQHWLRRVNLLRSRALHHLALNEPDKALADLDAAQAAAPPGADRYFQRSEQLGIDYARALALRQKGQVAEADALVMTTWHKRPYNRMSSLSARLVLGAQLNRPQVREVNEGLARLNPLSLDDMCLIAMQEGRFADAIALYGQLVPPHKNSQELLQYDFQIKSLKLENEVLAEMFWAARAGRQAFALAALGRADEARAMLTTARERLAKATVPLEPTPRKNGKPGKLDWTDEYGNKLKASLTKKAGESLDHWTAMVDLRLLAPTDPAAALAKAADAPIKSWPLAEVYRAAGEALPPDRRAALPKIAPQEAEDDEEAMPAKAAAVLMRTLPEAERADQLPPYAEAKHPRFSFKDSYNDLAVQGYRSEADPATGTTTIRLRASKGSSAVSEEMALLRAAELALAAGKAGFVVVQRRDIRHSIVATMYGTVMNETPDGNAVELEVAFVDPAALPAAYAATPWRVIDAAAARAALAPVYVAAP